MVIFRVIVLLGDRADAGGGKSLQALPAVEVGGR